MIQTAVVLPLFFQSQVGLNNLILMVFEILIRLGQGFLEGIPHPFQLSQKIAGPPDVLGVKDLLAFLPDGHGLLRQDKAFQIEEELAGQVGPPGPGFRVALEEPVLEVFVKGGVEEPAIDLGPVKAGGLNQGEKGPLGNHGDLAELGFVQANQFHDLLVDLPL